MEEMTVPFLVICGAIVAWCSWITIRLFAAEKDIAVNTSNDEAVSEQIKDVKVDVEKRIDRFEEHVNKQFDKVFAEIKGLTKQ